MVEGAWVVPHLLRRGLVASGDFVARPAIDRVPGRNLLYRVAFDTGPTFLLKQAVDPETRESLDREACMYDHLAACADGPLAQRLPRKLDYDPDASVLVLEYLEGYRPLAVPPGKSRDLERELKVAAELGTALRELSSLPPPPLDSRAPWILSLVHPPVGILREATPGILELMRSIQRSQIWCENLQRLELEWSPRSVVHGDLRFSNLLVRSGAMTGHASDLALVDWELAGPGSSAWDVGWVIAGMLAQRPGLTGETFPLLRAFWSARVDALGVAERGARLKAGLACAAAALLQMAYEAARAHPCPSKRVKRLLEMGRSLIERWDVWAESVFLSGREGACPTPAR